MIRVLVVDDSPVVRDLIVHVLSSDPDILVTGTAGNGEEALQEIQRNRPDIVTMDIHMPKMDGFETTSIIMNQHPLPIIIVTGSSDYREMETSFQAINAGALTVVKKPRGIGHLEFKADAQELIRIVKLMSEVRVVRHWSRRDEKTPKRNGAEVTIPSQAEIRVIAMGASTGGPPVIRTILSGLTKDFPVPLLIVQHMAAGFIQGFTEWLSQTSALPVHVAMNGSPLLPGHAYIAPDGLQMKVASDGRLSCADDLPENGLRPSVASLFRSVSAVFGKSAVAVLLTGMGKDGAEELKRLREKGAITIAQDKESSTVFGMPGEAVRINAAMYVLPPEEIITTLIRLADRRGPR